MTYSQPRHRLKHTQRIVLDVLRANPQISYDGLAEQAEIDRRTAIQAVRQLTRAYRIVKLIGQGRLPNRYLVTDRLLVCRPGYTPTPVVLTPEKRAALVERFQQRLQTQIGTAEQLRERQVSETPEVGYLT